MGRALTSVCCAALAWAATAAVAWTAWAEPVSGPSPINASPGRNAETGSLTAINGVPYIAWTETDGTNFEIRVARLNASGTDWEELVGGSSPINADAGRSATGPSLTAVDGVPYIAWTEADGTNVELRVARLNAAGTDWEELVGGPSPINASPTQDAEQPSLIAIGGIPHVAWFEFDGVNDEVRVARLNAAGNDWEELVGGLSPINADATRSGFQPSLAAINDVPYVAWCEADGANNELRVARVNAAGTDWEELVGGPSPINADAARSALQPSLAAINGVPFVAWRESDGVNEEVRVARLNAAGTDWEELVGGSSPINTDPAQPAARPRLSSIGGVPYVAWRESDAAVLQIRVKRLVPEFLAGSAAFPTGPTTALLLGELRTYGVAYPAAFELGPGTAFGTVSTASSTTDGQGEDTILAEISGLAPATQHSWRAFATDGTFRTATDITRTFTTPATPTPPAAPSAPAQPAARLVAALVAAKLSGLAGKRLPIAYFSTVDAKATLVLRRRGKLVATLTGTAKPGRNALTWATTAKKKPLAAGTYAFTLTLTSADGQTTAATGKATLTAPKPKPRRA